MLKKVKGMLKNQQGFTLVELLAVIVILGIIAAIAIPSIGNIIDNSKKDAHASNATMLLSAARLAVVNNETALWGTADTTTDSTDVAGRITAKELVKAGYLESDLKDPDGSTYTNAYVEVTKATTGYTYNVTLTGAKRSVTGAGPFSRNDVHDN